MRYYNRTEVGIGSIPTFMIGMSLHSRLRRSANSTLWPRPFTKPKAFTSSALTRKPGIQALERDGTTLPTNAGQVERREFNYIRHGTQVLTGNLHLATGKFITPTIADTRTEADFVEHIARLIQSDSK